MVPRVVNLLPRPRDSFEFTDYFFLRFPASTSTPACVSLSSWICNWTDHQALDINLEIGNPKCMWRQTLLDLTKDSHTLHKEQLLNMARVFPFILKTKHKILYVKWAWVGKFCKKKIYTNFDRSSLIFDRLSQADLHSKSCNILDSNFTLKYTLSKSKTRLNVLIMVCQHYKTKF